MGVTVFSLGVVSPLGVFRVAQYIWSELASYYSLYFQLGKLYGSTLCWDWWEPGRISSTRFYTCLQILGSQFHTSTFDLFSWRPDDDLL